MPSVEVKREAKKRVPRRPLARGERAKEEKIRLTMQGEGNGRHWQGAFLGFVGGNTADLVQRVEEGFPFSAFEHLQRNIALPTKDLIAFVQIPHRTLLRRKAQGRLASLESDRLLRLARLFGLSLELFDGNAEQARRWL